MSNNKEVFYYCTCNKDRSNGIRGEKEIYNYRLVNVSKDQICTNCGYYAVASDKIIDDDKLIAHVTREISEHNTYDEYGTIIVGGIVKKNKRLQNRRAKGVA